MPIRPQRLNNQIRNRLAALTTLTRVPVRVTAYAPRISVLLHERRCGIERVATLRAKEVTGMPFCSTSHNDLAFYGRFAALAARAEELVEVEVAVEAKTVVAVVGFLLEELLFRHRVSGIRDVETGLPGTDALKAGGALFVGFGVEGDALEVGVALVADEAA